MKKILIILVLIVTIIGAREYTTIRNRENETLTDELERYKQSEIEYSKNTLRMKELQNPQIINSRLEKVGKLIVAEGNIAYTDKLIEGSFLWKKKLEVTLNYRYGIAIELSNLDITFLNDSVVIRIEKDKLEIEYNELIEKDMFMDQYKRIFSSGYDEKDIKAILGNAKETVTIQIENDKNIFNKSMNNLKENLEELVLKLGYKEVILEVI